MMRGRVFNNVSIHIQAKQPPQVDTQPDTKRHGACTTERTAGPPPFSAVSFSGREPPVTVHGHAITRINDSGSPSAPERPRKSLAEQPLKRRRASGRRRRSAPSAVRHVLRRPLPSGGTPAQPRPQQLKRPAAALPVRVRAARRPLRPIRRARAAVW